MCCGGRAGCPAPRRSCFRRVPSRGGKGPLTVSAPASVLQRAGVDSTPHGFRGYAGLDNLRCSEPALADGLEAVLEMDDSIVHLPGRSRRGFTVGGVEAGPAEPLRRGQKIAGFDRVPMHPRPRFRPATSRSYLHIPSDTGPDTIGRNTLPYNKL